MSRVLIVITSRVDFARKRRIIQEGFFFCMTKSDSACSINIIRYKYVLSQQKKVPDNRLRQNTRVVCHIPMEKQKTNQKRRHPERQPFTRANFCSIYSVARNHTFDLFVFSVGFIFPMVIYSPNLLWTIDIHIYIVAFR